eukprot:3349310-Prymnesium_polylepis.1
MHFSLSLQISSSKLDKYARIWADGALTESVQSCRRSLLERPVFGTGSVFRMNRIGQVPESVCAPALAQSRCFQSIEFGGKWGAVCSVRNRMCGDMTNWKSAPAERLREFPALKFNVF